MTDNDPIRTFAEAKKKVATLERQLGRYGAFFGALASGLSGPPVRLMLSNTHGIDWSAPIEIGLGRDVPSVDYSQWPPKEDVAATLKDYYDAQHELRNAEMALSPDDRNVLQLS